MRNLSRGVSRWLLALALLGGAVLPVAVACDTNDEPLEEAGENIQDAVEDAGDAVEDAVD